MPRLYETHCGYELPAKQSSMQETGSYSFGKLNNISVCTDTLRIKVKNHKEKLF